MELNRDALIAYVYDVYSVEQAIEYTEDIIFRLKKAKEEMAASEKDEIANTISEKGNEARNVIETYDETPYRKEFGLFERKTTIISALVVVAYCIFWAKMEKSLNFSVMALIFILLMILFFFCAIFEANHLLRENIEKTDAINKKKQDNIENRVNLINSSKDDKISKITHHYSEKQAEIEEKLNMYYRQKKDFKNIRYDLYNDMLLIPAPHQDIFSVCYLYKYLITSRETDFKYIIEQLYQEKILTELKTLVNIQKNILIIQRKILAELKVQTNILSAIKGQISTYTDLFETKMNEIRSDLGDISDNQRAILNNQAIMYNAYMQNAVKASTNDEERNTYLKMIADSTKVSAMFERADFLDLKFDRNWSGDY